MDLTIKPRELYNLISHARDCNIENLIALQALILVNEAPAWIPALAKHLGCSAADMLSHAVGLIESGMALFDGPLTITEAGRDHLTAILDAGQLPF